MNFQNFHGHFCLKCKIAQNNNNEKIKWNEMYLLLFSALNLLTCYS